MEHKTEISVIQELEWETEQRPSTDWLASRFLSFTKRLWGCSPMERTCSPLVLYCICTWLWRLLYQLTM